MIKLYGHGGSDNHGCEAIVRSTVAMLDRKVNLYSLDVNSDKKYGVDALCKLLEDSQSHYSKKTPKGFLSAVQTKTTGKLDIYARFNREKLINSISKGDVCLSIGGDNYCYPGTDMLAAINRNIKKKGAKLVLWGCSVEPSLIENDELAADMANFDLITARESISYEVLKKVNSNTVRIVDPAFTLQATMLPLPENWIEGNMVGINASPLILHSGKDAGIVYMAYKSLIEEIFSNTDCGIALIPHVVSARNNDLEPLEKLYDEFKNTGRVVLIGDHNCMELKGYISRCRFFVGARTHATIAAYSTCVPTLVLGYSVKSRGIAKDLFGSEENYVLPVQSLEEPDELANHFMWLVEHETEIREQLEKIMPEYISKAYLGKVALDKLV